MTIFAEVVELQTRHLEGVVSYARAGSSPAFRTNLKYERKLVFLSHSTYWIMLWLTQA